MIWYFLLTLHFLVEIIGIISHVIFLKFMVIRGVMDGYARFNLGVISLSMIAMLVSYLAETLVCLSIGTVFEDAQCAQLDAKFYLTCIHRHSEMLSLTSLLFFTIERVLSIQFSKLHSSKVFQTSFILIFIFANAFSATYTYSVMLYEESTGLFWYMVLQIVILANFPFVYYAKRKSKSKYTAQVTTYSLKRKHNLYNYYEIARSFVFSIGIYLCAQLTVFTLLWLYLAQVLFPGEFHKLLFINVLIWNTNLSAFPWIVMLIHRSQRERIYRIWMHMFPNNKYHPEQAGPPESKIRGMNGKELVTAPTQTDYFNQLQKAWE